MFNFLLFHCQLMSHNNIIIILLLLKTYFIIIIIVCIVYRNGLYICLYMPYFGLIDICQANLSGSRPLCYTVMLCPQYFFHHSIVVRLSKNEVLSTHIINYFTKDENAWENRLSEFSPLQLRGISPKSFAPHF